MFLHWKRGEISNSTFCSWVVIWLALIFLAFFPRILEPLSVDLFFVRVMDLGMIVVFMVLTFLTVENNIKIKNYEKLLEEIVRHVAINKAKEKKVK